MKKLSADLVFDGVQFISNAIVIIDNQGTVSDIISGDQHSSDITFFPDAILCPGFINAHCHLELSHLKGAIPKGTGLDEFIRAIEAIRKAEPAKIIQKAAEAEQEMIANGIIAVGDISNTNNTFDLKSNSTLSYHTFIEVLGFNPVRAEDAFLKGKNLKEELLTKNLACSITPHAPYSASEKLLAMISNDAYAEGYPLTIHMQENREENDLFLFNTGKILERLKSFGIDTSFFRETGTTSLRSVLIKLPKCNKLQLVHNTFTTESEISWAEDIHKLLYWCFCPSANLYIENTLPSFDHFYERKVKGTLGTDSLASNDSLDILKEIRIIQDNSHIPLEELLRWATRNGAEFLGLHGKGKFEKGFTPGFNVISDVNVEERKLKAHSELSPIKI